jgi:hypothetical protein
MAVRLGIENVERRILKGLTAKQFADWWHYAQLEPFDETRADYRAASIVAMIANVNRGKKDKAFTLEDTVLRFGEREEKEKPNQTPAQQFAMLKILAAMHAHDGPAAPPPTPETTGGQVTFSDAPGQDMQALRAIQEQLAKARAAQKKDT